ncbi:hypothetical protein OAE97_00215 [Verrucomicrobia bacterium]|nr:hypothetical protein [Verrucomicrobiota bacterium]
MASFKKAFKVTKKTNTLSEQHNALAEAFNSRILSGIGDCAWRIFYYAYSTFRGLRNPNGNNYAPQDEWFKFYAYMEPKSTYGRFGWPQAPAGEPEGANTGNPFMAWIFGNDSRIRQTNGERDLTQDRIHGFWSEAVRLGGLELNLPAAEPPLKYPWGHPLLARVWFDSQFQRGSCAFIPNYKYLDGVGDTKTKELQLVSHGISGAARRHLRYVMESVSMGRYAPSYVPNADGKGGVFRKKNAVKDQVQQAMFHYLSYFRGVEDQRAKHNKINPTVRTDGFNFESFLSRQFILAPNYSEPAYEKDDQGEDIIDSVGNKKIKYDSSGFPELSPITNTFTWSRKLEDKEETNKITLNGGTATFTGENSEKEFNTNPNPNVNQNRFCVAALYFQTSDLLVKEESEASSLLNNLNIEVFLNGNLYEKIPIFSTQTPNYYRIEKRNNADGLGNESYFIYQFNKIHYFQYPVKGKLKFKLSSTETNLGRSKVGDYTLDKVKFFIKLAHVVEMKPTVADAYVVMRIATTEGAGGDAGQMDPTGHFGADNCKKVFNNYYRFGAAYLLRGGSGLHNNDTYVSANPVYESTRKFITNNIKMADRVTLVDYEVNSEGKSVLYFKRFAYGMKNTGIDIFRGMGPSITQIGNRAMVGSDIEKFIPIIKGKHYIVLDSAKNQDNFVVYNRINKLVKYRHGQTFVGGDYYYVSHFSNSTIGVFELDGITNASYVNGSKQEILPGNDEEKKQVANGNISNEWSMFMSYNLYHWSNSSAWKPEMYGDIMGALNSRCLTSSYALQYNALTSKNVKKHIANVTWRRSSLPLITESPSGYNYIENANTDMSKAGTLDPNYPTDFAKSCPIYKPPYKIESATRENGFDPRSRIIKVTLNKRLDYSSVNFWKNFDSPLNGKISENLDAYKNFSNDSDFRSDESAVIDYVLHYLTNKQCPRNKTGDVSLDNNRFWSKHRPFGCCYPRFYFVKLIPQVSNDTVMYSDHYTQMEYYLRSMSNGFLDPDSELSLSELERIIKLGMTGLDLTGGYDSAYGDYLFENLMKKSFDVTTQNFRPISPDTTSKF